MYCKHSHEMFHLRKTTKLHTVVKFRGIILFSYNQFHTTSDYITNQKDNLFGDDIIIVESYLQIAKQRI